MNPLVSTPVKGVNTPYDVIETPDLHYVRGLQVLEKHPEVKQLMGYDPWAAALTVSIVAAQLCLAGAVGKYCSTFTEYWWQITLLAYLAGGTLSHWAGMAIHECAHNLMAPTTRQNYLLAIFANTAIAVPAAIQFRRHHLLHHSHLGIEGIDNDFPAQWEARFVGKSPVRKFFWLFFYIIFITMVRGFLVKPTKWEWINITWIIVADMFIVYFFGWVALGYMLLSTFFGYSFHPTAGHFIHEHFILEEGQETNSYYGLLNLVCFNVGYHNEHHDLMNIPGRFLPKYHAIAKEYYSHLESTKSWSQTIFWHFVLSKKVGADSRYVRSESVRARGLQAFRQLRQKLQRLRVNDSLKVASPEDLHQ
ncbi:MAG: fatty acid desaturase [Bacteroidetes bacterium]|nr:fatty acid desaturase [Bacteroidota bacterium]